MLSERSIQIQLYWDSVKRNVRWSCPNIWLYDWESDFIAVSRSGYVTEYEIKISRSDFAADFKKNRNIRLGPNNFYYVCPPDMLTVAEMPAYAGLAYTGVRRPHVVKPAPRLHGHRLSGRQAAKILTSTYYRFWKLLTSQHK